MHIGIDIDGTITTPFYWLDFFNQKLGTSLSEKEITHYDHHLDFGIEAAAFQTLRKDHLKTIHRLAEPRPGAKDFVNRLFFENDQTFIITAREASLATLTQFWLKKEDFLYTALYTLGSTEKRFLAARLGIDLFFEDRLETALGLSAAGIPTVLFDTPYNQAPPHPGIHRVKTWEEAYRVYRTFKNEKTKTFEGQLKTLLHQAI
ncbi:MAG: hypothetical protein AVO33_02070 [delta proteobacterium ML8_F1]|nr:MAG: hypothetical protein AVO33_02070 [delta proteobacterium ML8_F1]